MTDTVVGGRPQVVGVQPDALGGFQCPELSPVAPGVAGEFDLEVVESAPAVAAKLPEIGEVRGVPEYCRVLESRARARHSDEFLDALPRQSTKQVEQCGFHGAERRRIPVDVVDVVNDPPAQTRQIGHVGDQRIPVAANEIEAAGGRFAGHIVARTALAVADCVVLRVGGDD
ncbi:MAG: hypothetical protein F4Z28_14910 [Gammaproteobacteria bacterium]|nr:hypothetical protein [Gammaproteobacteria bacterium]